ncbi:HD-GYP domain-containing protein [Aliikangiella coralliicola]|uniref:HD-GYP domain-containing protein n=1 Tax=Aliikangiella coralliicola TaxID=2592383 RepID=A0A545UAS4_9GAMM|nr:HD-GYP domain-containing protein [Aliikangiella coralliicola]TQV86565.1 HD-GYP domain-containing protein [Aliikangiella coralliicola]
MAGQYKYLKKIKVKTQNLHLGMYISELDKAWSESAFLFQGFPIETEEDLQAVRNECEWVYVDFPTREDYHVYLMTISNAKIKSNHVPLRPKNELSYELPKANNHYKNSTTMVKTIMHDIMHDEDFELAPVKQAVEDCIDSILSNQDALLLLSNIKNADEYTAEHCLRVAIMAIAFGKYLGLSQDELGYIGVGAMLHDVGKMRIPNEILNKPGKLTREEYRIMQKHSEEGYKILQQKPLLSKIAIDIAYSHHERIDGKGYPRKLDSSQISYFTKIVSIIDTYDAITSERVYSAAKAPAVAFKILQENTSAQFDEELTYKFVEWMGIYPVGSLVEMRTGEVGIVTKVYPEQKLKPRVLLVTDEEKCSGYEKVVNLSKMAVHSNGELYQIKKVHPNGAFGIQLDKYVKEGLVLQH